MIVNLLSVLIATLVGFGVTALWYSQYGFGEQWHAIMGGPRKALANGYTPRKTMLMELVSSLVTAYVLANLALALDIHGPLMAIRLALWVWVGLQATILYASVVFEGRPMKLFYLTASERLVTITAMMLIVGIWH